jgi:dynein heavy chain
LQAASGQPMVVWLSGLHMPNSFLMALVQIACRKNGWPIDHSTFYTTVTKYMDIDDVEERPDQVRIYIMQLLVIYVHQSYE